MDTSKAVWKARLYHDKVVSAQIKEDLEVMVRALIGEKRLEIKKVSGHQADQYPSCKCWEKQYCPAKPKKLLGYITPGGYMFYGNTEVEIYCKIITALVGDKIYFPFSVLPEGEKRKEES